MRRSEFVSQVGLSKAVASAAAVGAQARAVTLQVLPTTATCTGTRTVVVASGTSRQVRVSSYRCGIKVLLDLYLPQGNLKKIGGRYLEYGYCKL